MNCKQCKAWMSDAATDGLSTKQRAEFEAHVQECGRCHAEFGRMRALLDAIDRGLVASIAVEPSPDFIARVRRQIASAPQPTQVSWARWAPAAACAAVVIVATAAWLSWPSSFKPSRISKSAPISNPSVAADQPARKAPGTSTAALTPKDSAVARPDRVAAKPTHRRIEREPEILVPPGQAEAVLQYVAALRSGKIDGAKLMAELKAADQPIEIKPLVIAPLESSTEEDNKGSGSGSNGTRRDLVSAEPIQSVTR